MQGSTSVSFSYDQASRRASLALPNGIVAAYTYDSASRLTGMSWRLGGTSLGDLNYAHDGAGRIVKRLGSLATTGLPGAMPSATYDLANRLTNWNGTALSYDANGNMLGDGSNSYAWNARNQLAGLSGANLGIFMYDGLGRRAAKSIDGVTKQFLHDGLNPVQELSSIGTPTANLLTGLNIDEFFTRTDSAGSRALLTDILGSAIALADPTGAIATTYSYEPFGKAASGGLPSTNAFQFTGRENDGTGLYYYRYRYYTPALQRFLSEDLLEIRGDDTNLYLYVLNAPTTLRDPTGLWPFGLPKPDRLQDNATNLLRQYVPELTQQEACDLTKHAIDETGWKDVGPANDLFGGMTQLPPDLDKLTPPQRRFIDRFLDRLEPLDPGAAHKVRRRLKCPC